jgi:hypothetical protein
MVTIYKPRGPQKPSFVPEGIRPNHLVRFLRDAQQKCQDKGDEDAAFRLECIADYFEKDYKPGEPIRFKASYAGF